MNVITENHPVIRAIQNSNELADDLKLLTYSELLHLAEKKPFESVLHFNFPDSLAEDIDEFFEWNDSELGVTFWGKIQDKVWGHKRTC